MVVDQMKQLAQAGPIGSEEGRHLVLSHESLTQWEEHRP